MKNLARAAILKFVSSAPWGVREAILEACITRIGAAEVSARLFPRLGIVEVGAWGDLGLIRSAANDRGVLALYARTGSVENMIVKQVQAFFGSEAGTYIDIGANIGLTTIPIARNPLIRCITFEPEPGNFHYLQLNVATNVGSNRVEFHQMALLDHPGTVILAVADGNLGDHRVTKTGIPGRRSVEVPAAPLDDFADRIVGPLAVKIDTQGAEPAIVAGGGKVLARAGLLAMEFCPFLMRQLGGDPEIVIALMGGFDQIALTASGSDAEPVFLPPAQAQDELRAKLRTARDDDGDYLDIIAKRNVAG